MPFALAGRDLLLRWAVTHAIILKSRYKNPCAGCYMDAIPEPGLSSWLGCRLAALANPGSCTSISDRPFHLLLTPASIFVWS
jgi:hypothetical protein